MPDRMEAATIPDDDSARILAAAGWQSDPRRLPVLRNLLREHLRRIYFYSYEESRNRAVAIDRTRGTLMRVARTMQSIPAGCPLVTWIFLALEEARVPPAGNPDFWRLLVIAEEERRAAAGSMDGSTAGITDETTIGASAGTASHPMLRPLVSLYRRFLDVPESGDVEPRANWPAAETDLDCFLRAQFAETGDTTCRPAPVWRRWLASRPWRRPRNIAAAAIAVVVVAIAFVVGFTLVPPKARRATISGSARPPAADAAGASRSTEGPHSARTDDHPGKAATGHAPAPPNPESTSRGRSTDCQIASARAAHGLLARGKTSTRINGARCELITRDSLRFAWMPAQGVTEYRVCLITARRDTLGIVPAISGTCVTVPVKSVPHVPVPGSFIFRVDGLAGGQLVAVSDPQPFEIP
jgi:hypothetical protein